MFARQKETLLGMTYAEIQSLVFGVIKRYYDKEGTIKLSNHDKHNVAWHIIGAIFEASASFDPARGAVKPWMWTVAKNELISYLKGEADFVQRSVTIDIPKSKTAAYVAGIIDEFDTLTHTEMDALAAEIKALKADDQLILNLYLNRVAEKDIAVRLNMKYSTVRQKVRRIKAELALKVQARLKSDMENYACAA